VQIGDQVKLQLDALGDRDIDGRVDEIVPVSNPATRTSTVKIGFPRDNSLILRSGLFGRAHFPVGQRRVITVPQKAIVERGQLIGTYVVDDAGIARLRLIKTGKKVGDRTEVLAGLNEGDRIVSSGVEAVSDGAKVQ
jgi:RND family efflux transporter MFP subunit